MKHFETHWNSLKHIETHWNSLKILKNLSNSLNYFKLLLTPQNSFKLLKTPSNSLTLFGTPWNSLNCIKHFLELIIIPETSLKTNLAMSHYFLSCSLQLKLLYKIPKYYKSEKNHIYAFIMLLKILNCSNFKCLLWPDIRKHGR